MWKAVYPGTPVWTHAQLASHRALCPEGQFAAVDMATADVVGMQRV